MPNHGQQRGIMPRLSDEQWAPVPIHAPLLAFLKAEWDKWVPITRWVDRRLISEPNISDASENHLRACLISAIRGPLLQHLPQDTQWFEVKWLRAEHLHELRVIGRCGWDDSNDKNELLKVAARRPQQLLSDVDSWDPPILWGHSKTGPFTILEGNNRLTAYAASSRMSLKLPCYVGLSMNPCFWHLADDFHNGNT